MRTAGLKHSSMLAALRTSVAIHRPTYVIKAGGVQPGTQKALREFKTPKGGDGIFQDRRSFFRAANEKTEFKYSLTHK